MAQRRLFKELGDLSERPLPGATVTTENDNLFLWHVQLQGPATSVYKGGVFTVKVEFPVNYPFHAPKPLFVTRIFHPSVDNRGAVCLSCTKADSWKPSTTGRDVINELMSLLHAPSADDAVNMEAAELMRNDAKRFESTARDWVKKYASS